ncbi:GNAT family N-acetyltransferase [Thiosocius teredinicola]|uniref:GNAT family N-acetyltransferase n=1 Tax=Thiosocius teredinicola TaxID=1973002 RepID=UPI00099112DD
MIDISFRAATEADLPSILDLYSQPELDDGKVLTLPAAQAVFNQINALPGYGLYVAVHEQQIVGTFALMIMPNLGHCGTPSGVLEDIVVTPEQQGLGIGTAMIEEAMRLCGAAGCYKMTLSSNLKRERAHAFYDKLGFDKHGYSLRIAIAGE